MSTVSLPTKEPITPQPPSLPPSKPHTPSPTQRTQRTLHRITLHPTLTPYRRRVYRTLLSIPPGRWTTYSALAKYLNSSARAVGNAMRTNPFAPEVPCHRVLAADGSLGGYKGEWRVSTAKIGDGSFLDEKRSRLEREGVGFDKAGKARGVCFVEFSEVRDLMKGGK